LKRPRSRFQPNQPQHRINGRIRAREVRVIGVEGQQVGILDVATALSMARQYQVDLVEIAPNAQPPVCRLVDYGKFRYELSKKDRETRKHQHVNEVKEIQLTARIDPHDMGIKLDHAVDFLSEEMKLKVSLRFRGREMAHTEIGRQVVEKFLQDLAPWGHADSPPRLAGRTINVMVSPLPKGKRAANPKESGDALASEQHAEDLPPQVIAARNSASNSAPRAPRPFRPARPPGDATNRPAQPSERSRPAPQRIPTDAAERKSDFGETPFAGLSLPQE